VLTQPFLTDLDSRAAIKGSRDPLGVQSIWTRMGRHVVGNLTTVTKSLRDFTTMLLGYYFAERVADEGGEAGDLATFLKWEQLAAYARGVVNNDWTFRGTERAQKNLNEGGRIKLGTDSTAQILSNQKIYGLWGLFTVPGRSSGFLEGDPTRLTNAGGQLVKEVYLPMLAKAGFRNADAVVDRLKDPKSTVDPEATDRPLLEAIAKLLGKRVLSAEALVYRQHLLLGGPLDRTNGLQEVLAQLLMATLTLADWQLSPASLQKLSSAARGHGERGERLSDRLNRIRTCELLLAPAVAVFEFLLGSNGQTPAEVSRTLRGHWSGGIPTIDVEATTGLESELREATGDAHAAARWMAIARALASGSFEDAFRTLLEHNASLMATRGSAAPWIVLREGRFEVRFRDEHLSALPTRRELPQYWRHPYFLDSLRAMTAELAG
jgi:hypothetical protein